MGNCNASDNTEQIFRQYSRADVKAHFVAMVKLEHLTERIEILKHEADQDVQKIRENSFKQIAIKREQVLGQFNQQIKIIKENKEQFDKINKKNQTVEEYVGLTTAEHQLNEYERKSIEKFDQIKSLMINNNEAIFTIMREEILQDMVVIQETPRLKKVDVDNFFNKMKMMYRDEAKKSELQIENEFRQKLTPDYYRKQLKAVISAETLREIAKMKPKTFNAEPIIEEPKIPEPRGWCFC